jgi:FKBP-type peptidyl-prolyl cis-trans isomerase FkpA
MKSNVWILSVLGILGFAVIAGCQKGPSSGTDTCTDLSVGSDSAVLLNYAAGNGITPVKDSTGLYYQIITQGSGATPNINSTVFVTYTGKLMSGAIFDSTTNSAKTGFILNQLIPGWQIGLQKIQTGGRIKLLIPSALGYGCIGSLPIVASNAPLYFDITLVGVQ